MDDPAVEGSLEEGTVARLVEDRDTTITAHPAGHPPPAVPDLAAGHTPPSRDAGVEVPAETATPEAAADELLPHEINGSTMERSFLSSPTYKPITDVCRCLNTRFLLFILSNRLQYRVIHILL